MKCFIPYPQRNKICPPASILPEGTLKPNSMNMSRNMRRSIQIRLKGTTSSCSRVGPPGPPGPTGNDGSSGQNGKNGKNGYNGVDGRDVDGHTPCGPELVHHANDVGAQPGVCVQGGVALLLDHGGFCGAAGGCARHGDLPALRLVLSR